MRQDNGSVSTPPVRRRNRSLAPTTKPASARSLIPIVSGVEANTCPVRSSSQASSAGEPWRTRARRLRDTTSGASGPVDALPQMGRLHVPAHEISF